MSKSIAIFGAPGKGKTTFVKNRLKKVSKNALHLHDVNNEYTEFYDKPFERDITKFSKKATKITNGCIVFEEATIFFSNHTSNTDITEILVRKRHTNNTIFFVFHSVRTIPRNILDLINYVVLFKTNDTVNQIKKINHPEILEAFERVNAHPDNHYFEIITLN